MNLEKTKKSNVYGQILKSSSIVGGAVGINLLIGIVRTKFAAVLIGASGVVLDWRNHVVVDKSFTRPLEILNGCEPPVRLRKYLAWVHIQHVRRG